ncbi:unnamed protein product [Coffea canephora]|uniref:Tudor domain-containing protein n=1 Tax=Coffea canephora TaxID=49390 RepID=A0A068U0Y5_COFCA|nr:unnamed protein product [Coffea canephora]
MRGSENVAAEDSTTISDDGGATTVTYNDIEDSKEDEKAVDLPPNPAQHPPTQPQASPYQEGELVLAYHNQRVYPAKIMKVDLVLNEWRYSVHYPVSSTFLTPCSIYCQVTSLLLLHLFTWFINNFL